MDEHPRKSNLLLRLLAFLVTLTLAAGAIFLVANRDRINFDALRRWITYRSLERSDTGQAESFPYNGAASNVFSTFGDDLLVCFAGGMRLYSGSGTCYVEQSAVLDQPASEVNGSTAAVWSVGGDKIYLYRNRTQYAVLDGLGGSLLSVRLNSSGWLAVLTHENGYKAVATIYDRDLKKLMSFNLSAFVIDAVVTEDCKSLAAVVIGQENMSFESTLTLYPLTGYEAGVYYDVTSGQTWPLGNNIILETREDGDIWFVGDSGVSIWDGDEVCSWSCAGRYLKNYALGDGFAAVLSGKFRAGSQAELVTVDSKGRPSPGLVINEQVLSLSAAGRYVAVLTAGKLNIYTKDLNLYDTLENTSGARQVLMRPDGTALLVGSETAHLYIP